MTHAELARIIGKVGTIESDRLTIPVRIMDGRTAYGRQDVLVTPLEGSGERWVDAARVTLEGGTL